MFEAARAGHENIVARLFSMDPSLVDARTPDGEKLTPLHLAARHGHDGVVAQLLAFSPQSSDARDYDGRTALHLAAEKGHDKIVVRLLTHNPALIDAVASDNKKTALHFAAFEGHESTVAQLLTHSPNLFNLRTIYNHTALHFAVSRGHDKVVAQLLAFSPQSSDERDSGHTLLHLAAGNGHDKVVERLLAHDPALIDAVTSSDNMTALHLATCAGHESTVVHLLSYSPGLIDMKAGINNTDTALHYAAFRVNVKVVAELLALRPSFLVEEDSLGRTPLFCAAIQGRQEVVDLFPLTTDQVHRCDKEGKTLLHWVVLGKSLNPAFIQRIWEMNPDALFVADERKQTVFDCAIGSVNEWAIEYFQWKLSIWSIEEALVKVARKRIYLHTTTQLNTLQLREQRFRELVLRECEPSLLLSLPRDCVHLILSDYLFLADSLVIIEGSKKKRAIARLFK